jgi:hypothetical protein
MLSDEDIRENERDQARSLGCLALMVALWIGTVLLALFMGGG